MQRSKTYYRVRSVARFITGLTVIFVLTVGGSLLAQILIHLMTGK